jgi:hypothetical protein
MTPKTERMELRLDTETINQVDNWRKEQSDLPSRSEAVRRLIETGLGTTSRQNFLLMKFHLLTASLLPGAQEAITDAHAFAWQNDVYPFHDHAQEYWAEPFSAHFKVNKQMIEELATYLDDLWLKKKTVTFYELEDRYQVSLGSTDWDRCKLIDACRYMYLRSMFDEAFWNGVVKPMEHPIEAKSIVDKFDHADEMFLG